MLDSNLLNQVQQLTSSVIQKSIDAEWVNAQKQLGQTILDAAKKGDWTCRYFMTHQVNGFKAVSLLEELGFKVNQVTNRSHPVDLLISWEPKK